MLEWIGWLATAMFGASYLFKQPSALRAVQALAAMLWIAYGVTIHAVPVIVANAIVAGMAIFSSFVQRASRPPVTDPSPYASRD
jgi:hypothetical protein